MMQIILMTLISIEKPKESLMTDKSRVSGFGTPIPICCPKFNQLKNGMLPKMLLKRAPSVIPVNKKRINTNVFFHFIMSTPLIMFD